MVISVIKADIKKFVSQLPSAKGKKELYENMIYSFVTNKSGKSRRELLEITKKIDWYTNDESQRFIIEKFIENVSTNDYLLLKFKDGEESSSNKFINIILSEGFFESVNLLKLETFIDFNDGSVLLDKTVIIIDDFIGTGNTIFKAIRKFSEQQKFFVIAHTITKQAIARFRLRKEQINLFYHSKAVLSSYKEKINNRHQLNIIEQICSAVKNPVFKYGFGALGLMVTYEGISPNNNLPMLWYNEYNEPYENWVPLFDRTKNSQLMNQIKNSIFNNPQRLITEFKKFKDVDLSVNEFRVLLALRLKIHTPKELFTFLNFDTFNDLKRLVEKLQMRKIIFLFENDYHIIESINNRISEVINSLISSYYSN